MKKLVYIVVAFASLSITAEAEAQNTKKKGAIIGAGTGAATGAIINKKNRSKGAIIGGVVGGGIGYMYGRRKEKKREEAQIAAANRAAVNNAAANQVVYQYPVYSNYKKAYVSRPAQSATTGKLNSVGSYSAFGDESYEAYYNRRKSW